MSAEAACGGVDAPFQEVRFHWSGVLLGGGGSVGGGWLSAGMQSTADTREALDSALAAVLAAPVLPRTASDAEVLAAVAGWEAIGRVVDVRRVRAAAEVEWRSRTQLSPHGLAERCDARGGADLVSTVARISTKEARRRIGIGTALLPASA